MGVRGAEGAPWQVRSSGQEGLCGAPVRFDWPRPFPTPLSQAPSERFPRDNPPTRPPSRSAMVSLIPWSWRGVSRRLAEHRRLRGWRRCPRPVGDPVKRVGVSSRDPNVAGRRRSPGCPSFTSGDWQRSSRPGYLDLVRGARLLEGQWSNAAGRRGTETLDGTPGQRRQPQGKARRRLVYGSTLQGHCGVRWWCMNSAIRGAVFASVADLGPVSQRGPICRRIATSIGDEGCRPGRTAIGSRAHEDTSSACGSCKSP